MTFRRDLAAGVLMRLERISIAWVLCVFMLPSSGCSRLNPFEYSAYRRAVAADTLPALHEFTATYPRSSYQEQIAGAIAALEARIRRLHSESFEKLSHRRVDEAAASLSELLRLSPDDQIALNNIALTTLLKGDVNRSADLFGRPIERTNSDCCPVKDVVLFAVYSAGTTGVPTGVLGAFLPADVDAPPIEPIGKSNTTMYFLTTGEVKLATLSAYVPSLRTAVDVALHNTEAFKKRSSIIPLMRDVQRVLDDGRRVNGILLPPSSKIVWRDTGSATDQSKKD